MKQILDVLTATCRVLGVGYWVLGIALPPGSGPLADAIHPSLFPLPSLAAGAPRSAQTHVGTGYILGPDDVIDISVPSHSSFDSEKELNKSLTILPDGKINYGGVGVFMAAGKTAAGLADEIKAALEKTRDHVVTIVTVKEIHSQRVRIVGAVKAAGSYDLKPTWRILDLIAVAGGLSAKPTHINGQIVRGTDTLVDLDIARAIDKPNSDANVAIQVGDLVLLKEQDIHNQVGVMGQVNRPGAFDLEDNCGVLSIISQAGGVTESAALSRAYVTRGAQQIRLNLAPSILQGQPDPDVSGFRFHAGDVLMIPAITARFSVLGQVNRPGAYPISEVEAPTVLKALGMAGGQMQDSDLRGAGIVRVVTGKATFISVRIDTLLKRGSTVSDIPLQADDVLFIPSRKRDRGFSWSNLLSPLSVLYYLNHGL